MPETKPIRVPESEIKNRIRSIQKEMDAAGIEGLLVIQRVDLFYFSGTSQNGILYIPVSGAPLLMVKRYFPRAKSESAIRDTVEIGSVKELSHRIRDAFGSLPSVLGLELDVLPVREFEFFKKLLCPKQIKDASPIILDLRRIKSIWEIGQMEKTAEMSRLTFEYMRTMIRPGISEMEFAGMYETFARRHGHAGMLRDRNFQGGGAYSWHVLSGESGGMPGVLDAAASGEGTSAAFPSGAGNRRLERNEPIMVDFGSVRHGYHMDETRMFAIGSMPAEAQKASRAAIEIHDAVLERARPGAVTGDLFRYSVDLAEKLGYGDQYLGPRGHQVRFIGHGIGLELIEPPIIAQGKTDLLEPGMTFALEPKMVFQGAFAAGVESVFQVTTAGSRLISTVPVDIFIC
ncbi:MAG: aminopeptidase P family protein [Deltaproteobacteria bacterium]|nr:aminopeptidase P family protein [Deltaproteobacteria bacterium]MBW2041991.1 aminopeptidase P family protein [Deltaproteobacteria bacterium]MBW2132357.1 aminopeptidase P family protein [Deltaproteobacteria bacterium]